MSKPKIGKAAGFAAVFSGGLNQSKSGSLVSKVGNMMGSFLKGRDSDDEDSDRNQAEVIIDKVDTRTWPYRETQYMHLKESCPDKFLEEVANKASVGEIYSLVDCCFMDADFACLGVTLRIEDENLKKSVYKGQQYIV
jgi:hypothetical protein